MTNGISSALELEAFTICHVLLDVIGEPDGDASEARANISYDFFQHASESNKYRIRAKVAVEAGAESDPIFNLEVEADAFVRVPDDAADDEVNVLLTNGVALLYSTLRGSLAGLLGQTSIRGFVLPAIDMNKVARAAANGSVLPAPPEPH
jgi:preprotein translocase subunit SecB